MEQRYKYVDPIIKRIVDQSKSTARMEFGSLRKSIRAYNLSKTAPYFEAHELAYGGARGKGRPIGYKGKYRGTAVRTSYGMNSLLEENVRKLVNTNPEIKWKIIREDPRSGKQWIIEYKGNGKQPDGKGDLVDKTPKENKKREQTSTQTYLQALAKKKRDEAEKKQ